MASAGLVDITLLTLHPRLQPVDPPDEGGADYGEDDTGGGEAGDEGQLHPVAGQVGGLEAGPVLPLHSLRGLLLRALGLAAAGGLAVLQARAAVRRGGGLQAPALARGGVPHPGGGVPAPGIFV